jgi:hypothetical protein
VRSHPTAGQATLEYIAAVALVAALLLVAAPAVGAPSIARAVADAMSHALCVVGGDICDAADARRAGLPPCPLRSDTTGAEGSVTAFSIELGGRWTLQVTPRSDGSVAVTRLAGVSGGVVAGAGGGLEAGPLRAELQGEGAVRLRVQGARGWVLPDAATAKRFLEHAVKNSAGDGWPASWWSAESAAEATVTGSVVAGADADQHGEAVSVSAGGSTVLGRRFFRDGSTTAYWRWAAEGPELNLPFVPSPKGLGKAEWVAEYTSGPHGEPRELILRTATEDTHNTLTETVAHLDLSDPVNYAYVDPAVDSNGIPHAGPLGSIRALIMRRMATHGTIERYVSAVSDGSRGASLDFKAGLKFGLGGKHVKVTKTLTQATVQRGALVGSRLDCLPSRA